MAWIQLLIAGLAEIVWAIGLKYSESFSKPIPSAITLVFMAISIFFLSKALQTLPIGNAYAIWTGIGAVGTAILGIILFNEPKTLVRFFFIACIITGIIGLKYSS